MDQVIDSVAPRRMHGPKAVARGTAGRERGPIDTYGSTFGCLDRKPKTNGKKRILQMGYSSNAPLKESLGKMPRFNSFLAAGLLAGLLLSASLIHAKDFTVGLSWNAKESELVQKWED